MKTIVKAVVVLMLALVVYSAYLRYEARPHGIAADHPLGKFSKLDEHLTDRLQLEKSEVRRVPHSGIRSTARMYQYRRPGNQHEHVVLLLDSEENVRGVVGYYFVRQAGRPLSAIGLFSRSYWGVTGGAGQAEFKVQQIGRESMGQAEFTTARVTGIWRKWSKQGSGELIYLRANP